MNNTQNSQKLATNSKVELSAKYLLIGTMATSINSDLLTTTWEVGVFTNLEEAYKAAEQDLFNTAIDLTDYLFEDEIEGEGQKEFIKDNYLLHKQIIKRDSIEFTNLKTILTNTYRTSDGVDQIIYTLIEI